MKTFCTLAALSILLFSFGQAVADSAGEPEGRATGRVVVHKASPVLSEIDHVPMNYNGISFR